VGASGDHENRLAGLGSGRRFGSVRVLEADPELGLRIAADQISRAREGMVTAVVVLDCGVWEVPEPQGRLGFLVLEGLLAKDLTLAGSVSTELIGDGDVLQPWLPARDEGLVSYHASWHVLSRLTLAVLDDRFERSLAEWPQVAAALLERAIRRTLRMSIHQALLQLSPAETRLLVLFWHLAERWGRVTPAGVVLPLHLTHEVLGQLVGCQRPSVTTALKEVGESGLALRRPGGGWLLRGSPPDEMSQLQWHRRDREDAGLSGRAAARARHTAARPV
jgi:hypothetical protein